MSSARRRSLRDRRRVCFVTGTRAEFGLMRTVLEAIRDHPALRLQLVCTGMHLDPAHGRSIDTVRAQGWRVDAVVPWGDGHSANGSPDRNAADTGAAMSALAATFRKLDSDVVLVVGDRVEAFAAAAAGHVAHRVVAHVHGGDRALGQVDDSLRHAITKLAHLHFPATRESAERLRRLGEHRSHIRLVGSPGVDGIRAAAAPRAEMAAAFPELAPGRFALLVLHPTGPDVKEEYKRAGLVADVVRQAAIGRAIVVYPNNDPGAAGILRRWDALATSRDSDLLFRRNVPRPQFLGLMRDAAVMVGNSSSGIIEAASFGTPVVDIGLRQAGRERSANVTNVPFARPAILRALRHAWKDGRPRHRRCVNVYGGGGAGRRIAAALARAPLNAGLFRKLITY